LATPRLFTLEEATALLAQIEPIVRGLQRAKRALDQAASAVGDIVRMSQGNGDVSEHLTAEAGLEERLADLRGQIESQIEEVQSLGCLVKDLDLGLVDFPSLRDGQVVYLCWRVGEQSIAFWHDIDSGFGGRRPL
jgi:hypothetical protein